jgi:hypothetical protein
MKYTEPRVSNDYALRDLKAHGKEDELAEILADPVAFAELVDAGLWSKQLEILSDLDEFGRVAVRAGHSVGKTRTAAVAALWWVFSRTDATVLLIAPTWSQAKNVDLPEIKKLIRDNPMLRAFAAQADAETLETTIKFGLAAQSQIRCLSTNDPSRLQGYHGNILLILDEAAGIRPELFGAFEGIAAGGSGSVSLLALGNPTVTSGPFYDMFMPSSPWKCHRIGAFDSPNFDGVTVDNIGDLTEDELNSNKMPFLITKDFVAQKIEEWGPTSAAFQARVLGEFPSEGSDALVQLDWLNDAVEQKDIDGEDDRVFVGLDVAYTGSDETVMVARRGRNIIGLHRWMKEDTRGDVLRLLNTKYSDVCSVRVDSIGVGSFYEKWLADQGVPTIAANVAQSPSRHLKKQYKNLRAEAWWSIRTQLKDREIGGLSNLEQKDADELCAQLSSPKYKYDGSGRLVIESKDDMKRRGVSSPDLADALVLCFADIARWAPAGEFTIESTMRF